MTGSKKGYLESDYARYLTLPHYRHQPVNTKKYSCTSLPRSDFRPFLYKHMRIPLVFCPSNEITNNMRVVIDNAKPRTHFKCLPLRREIMNFHLSLAVTHELTSSSTGPPAPDAGRWGSAAPVRPSAEDRCRSVCPWPSGAADLLLGLNDPVSTTSQLERAVRASETEAAAPSWTVPRATSFTWRPQELLPPVSCDSAVSSWRLLPLWEVETPLSRSSQATGKWRCAVPHNWTYRMPALRKFRGKFKSRSQLRIPDDQV